MRGVRMVIGTAPQPGLDQEDIDSERLADDLGKYVNLIDTIKKQLNSTPIQTYYGRLALRETMLMMAIGGQINEKGITSAEIERLQQIMNSDQSHNSARDGEFIGKMTSTLGEIVSAITEMSPVSVHEGRKIPDILKKVIQDTQNQSTLNEPTQKDPNIYNKNFSEDEILAHREMESESIDLDTKGKLNAGRQFGELQNINHREKGDDRLDDIIGVANDKYNNFFKVVLAGGRPFALDGHKELEEMGEEPTREDIADKNRWEAFAECLQDEMNEQGITKDESKRYQELIVKQNQNPENISDEEFDFVCTYIRKIDKIFLAMQVREFQGKPFTVEEITR